jgi:hypothetical protein
MGVLANPHFAARGDLVVVADPEIGPVTIPRGPGTIRQLGRDDELERLRARGVTAGFSNVGAAGRADD